MIKGAMFRENLKVSLQSIRTNRLRTILTIFIIAFGIMALVGILTAIDSIEKTFTNQLTRMGANTFVIESHGMNIQIGKQKRRKKNYTFINYRQAEAFKEKFTFPAEVSIWAWATGMATVKYESNKTNPNIPVVGADENNVDAAGLEIDKGRNFSSDDVANNRNYVVIGSELVSKLFPNKIDPIDKVITIGSGRYKVVGTLKTKGSSMGMSNDNMCIIPYTNMRQYFSRPNMNYSINVKPNSANLMEAAIGEAEGVFREVRNLDPKDESDFNINKSDTLVEILLSSLKNIRFAAIVIGAITLFGAVIGLMNIMLVSVTERTREIGIRKAMGAKSQTIMQQFLFEAIVIGQLGGAFGIVLGILIGNVVSLLLKTAFVVPWQWISLGVFLCFIVGIVSGYFPAVKAARQDPIEALRYE
jgi:putative ABC transport system permease protein